MGLFFFTQNAHAATYTWDGGGGDANWNTAANWSSDIVPTVTDVALFDGTCSSNCSATINVSIVVDGISLASDYAGTVTQASGVTVEVDASDGFTIAGGTFVGGDSLISLTTQLGDFAQTGGTFTNSSGGLSIYRNLTLSGGTFNNSYDVTLTDINSSGSVDSTVTCTGTLPGRLVINKNDVNGTASDVTIASGCSVSLGAGPTTNVADFTVNGTVNVASGTWTYISAQQTGLINNGTVNHSGTGWLFTSSGIVNNVGGTINYSGTSITIDNSFTQNGTFDLTGKTVTFTNSVGSNQTIITCTGDLGGVVVMNKLGQSGEAHATIASGCSVNLGADPVSVVESNFTNNGTIVIASGTWTHSAIEIRDLINNGTITHLGTGWDINNAGFINSGTVTYAGTLVSVDKDFDQSGTFDLTGKTVEITQTDGADSSVISCAGTIGGVMLFSKTSTSGTNNITISAGCAVTMSTAASHTMEATLTNNGTINVASGTWEIASIEGGASITNNGTITHSGTGWDINHADLINNGTITYAGSVMYIDDDFTQNGTFDLTGITVHFNNGTGGGRTTTITCTGDLGGTVVINKLGSVSSATTTIAAGCSINLGASPNTLFQTALVNNGTIVIASGTWTVDREDGTSFTNNGTITHNGSGWDLNMVNLINNGTITYAGSDIYFEGNYTHGTGTFDTTGKTLYFDGALSTSDSTLSCSANILGNIVINKTHSSSNFALGSNCTVEGDFTRTNGPITNPASAYTLTIYGDLSYSTTDTFGGANLNIKFGGSASQTITQNDTPGTNTSLFVVDKSDPNSTVTLATNLVLGSTLTITSGVFDHGSIYNLTSGAVSIGASGVWSNTGTGDIVLSGDVSNAGTITFKSNNVGTCAEGVNDIAITSSVAATQRTWSGAGTFTIYNVSVTDQAGTITVYSSDLNNSTWVDEVCGPETITISGTVYSDEGVTTMVGTQTVRIKINGAGDYSGTISSGAYSVGSITIASAGDVITVYLDGATEKAVTVTRAANTSSDITNLDLYENMVIVRDEDAGPLTNTNLDQYDSGNDADIQFTVTAGALTVASGNTLLLNTLSSTFTPGGNVTAPAFKQTNGTFNAGTNTIDIDGDFTVSGGTYSASSNNTYIGGNLLISGGTFTHNSGTVILDGTGAQSINAMSSSVGALTIDKSAQVATLASHLDLATAAFNITTGTFSQGASYNLTSGAITVGASGAWSNLGTGDVTLSGSVTNTGIITLNSNAGSQCVDGIDDIVITSSDIRDAWRMWSGAGTFNIYNVTASYQDGTITVYNSTLSNTSWTNGSCSSTITVSGTVYSDAGASALTTTPTVRIKINGAGDYSAVANSSGVYSIDSITIASASDVVTVYLDGATEKAVVVTKAADTSTNITNLNLYQNYIILRHEDAGPITNADIGQYDSTDDSDLMFAVAGPSGLTVDSSMATLVWSGDTYTPETGVTVSALEIDGTINLNTNDPTVTVTNLVIDGTFTASNTAELVVSGDFTNNGTFTHNNGTIVFDGSNDAQIISGGASENIFYNFMVTNGGGKTIQFEAGEATKFEGTLTLAGTSEGALTIDSTSSTQWELWSTGSIVVSRLVIQNSGCYAGTNTITANTTVLNGGNNDATCWLFIVRGGGGTSAPVDNGGPGGEGAIGGGGSGAGGEETGGSGPGGEGAAGGGTGSGGGSASP